MTKNEYKSSILHQVNAKITAMLLDQLAEVLVENEILNKQLAPQTTSAPVNSTPQTPIPAA